MSESNLLIIDESFTLHQPDPNTTIIKLDKVPTFRIFPSTKYEKEITIDDSRFGLCVPSENELSINAYIHEATIINDIYINITTTDTGKSIPDNFTEIYDIWISRIGTIYVCNSHNPLTAKLLYSVEECVREVKADVPTGWINDEDSPLVQSDSNREYKVTVWLESPKRNTFSILFNYLEGNEISSLLITGLDKTWSSSYISCYIHHTQPYFVVNNQLWMFDKVTKKLLHRYTFDNNEIYSIKSNFLVRQDLHYAVDKFSYYSLFDCINQDRPMILRNVIIESEWDATFIFRGNKYPGLLFVRTQKSIIILNTDMIGIVILELDDSFVEKGWKVSSMFDQYMILSKDCGRNSTNYYRFIRLPLTKGLWFIDRLLWLGHLKSDKDCPLHLLPRDLIHELLSWIHQWTYDSSLLQ